MKTQEFVVKVKDASVLISQLPADWNDKEVKIVVALLEEPNLEESLVNLTKDLLWMSESDAPWKVKNIGKAETTEGLSVLKNSEKIKEPIDSFGVDEFFKFAVLLQDWHNETDRKQAQGYQALTAFIKENFVLAEVFKSGQIERQVHVVLKDKNENWYLLKTESVET